MEVSILNVREGSYDSLTTSAIVASEETDTIPCENGKDNRMAILVKNADAANIKFVVKAPTTGGGVRSSLGDLTVEIVTGTEALVPLFDTARFKVIADNNIVYALTDVAGAALGATPRGNVTMIAMQL